MFSAIAPPSLCRELWGSGERLDGNARYQRLPAAGVPPRLAHLGTDGLGIDRPAHRIGDRGAVERAVDLGTTATDQLVAQVSLAVLQIRDLGFHGAELVGNIAGREVVEWRYNRDSLGHDDDSCLGLGRAGCSNTPFGRLKRYTYTRMIRDTQSQ